MAFLKGAAECDGMGQWCSGRTVTVVLVSAYVATVAIWMGELSVGEEVMPRDGLFVCCCFIS